MGREDGGRPVFSLESRDEKNLAQDFPTLQIKCFQCLENLQLHIFKTGYKRAISEQITSGKKKVKEILPRFLLSNVFWSGHPIAWHLCPSLPVSHTPGTGKVILGWQTTTAAHCVCPEQQGRHLAEAVTASRPESHSHEKQHLTGGHGQVQELTWLLFTPGVPQLSLCCLSCSST